MTAVYLSAYRENAAYEAAVLLPRVSGSGIDPDDLLAFSTQCRIRGVASLLLDGLSEPLHRELCRSGRALLYLLSQTGETAPGTGQLSPFFDAVAAADWDCARDIAERAPRVWRPGEEYEDDFLYIHFLMRHVILGAPASESEGVLTRWASVLDGAEDLRFDVARALFARSGSELDAALHTLLEAEQLKSRRLSRAGALGQEIVATLAHVSVEGLALVRLAQSLGLATASHYPGVPTLALQRPPPALTGDAWRTLD